MKINLSFYGIGRAIRLAETSDVSELSKYLSIRPQLINKYHSNGYTLLHTAVKVRKTDMVLMLLIRGADINSLDTKDSSTPLSMAIEQGYDDVASVLIARGANLTTRNKALYDPLHLACINNCSSIIMQLLDKGSNINSLDANGNTALMLSLHYENSDIATILMNRGADYSVQNKFKKTALDMAKERGLRDICAQLEEIKEIETASRQLREEQEITNKIMSDKVSKKKSKKDTADGLASPSSDVVDSASVDAASRKKKKKKTKDGLPEKKKEKRKKYKDDDYSVTSDIIKSSEATSPGSDHPVASSKLSANTLASLIDVKNSKFLSESISECGSSTVSANKIVKNKIKALLYSNRSNTISEIGDYEHRQVSPAYPKHDNVSGGSSNRTQQESEQRIIIVRPTYQICGVNPRYNPDDYTYQRNTSSPSNDTVDFTYVDDSDLTRPKGLFCIAPRKKKSTPSNATAAPSSAKKASCIVM